MALYTDDATLLPPHQPTGSGHAAVRQIMEGHAAAEIEVHIVAVETKHFGELAQMGTWPATKRNGKALDRGKFIQIWKQVDGSWKIHRDIWMSDYAASIQR